jgi:hypothetical protein
MIREGVRVGRAHFRAVAGQAMIDACGHPPDCAKDHTALPRAALARSAYQRHRLAGKGFRHHQAGRRGDARAPRPTGLQKAFPSQGLWKHREKPRQGIRTATAANCPKGQATDRSCLR